MYHFFCEGYRENKNSIVIMQALTTDGVKPEINIRSIKNIVFIALIFDFEVFIFFSRLVVPITIIPMCVPDTAKM